jgi:hypothetical protein
MAKKSKCMDHIMREAKHVKLNANINRENCFSLSRSWKPLIHNLREWNQAFSKNMMPSSAPWKGHILLLLHSLKSPNSITFLKAPYWSRAFLPYPFSLIGPFPSEFLPQTLYKPSTS